MNKLQTTAAACLLSLTSCATPNGNLSNTSLPERSGGQQAEIEVSQENQEAARTCSNILEDVWQFLLSNGSHLIRFGN